MVIRQYLGHGGRMCHKTEKVDFCRLLLCLLQTVGWEETGLNATTSSTAVTELSLAQA